MSADRPQIDTNTDFYPSQSGVGTGREVKEKVQDLAHETQHKVEHQLVSGIESFKDRAATNLETLSQSLMQSTQQTRQQDPDAPVQYVERVGQELQRASHYLRETDIRQVVHQTENFARRQPAVFLGAAFAIGLLGARFIKSSQRGEQRERFEEGGHYRAPPHISDRERPVAGYREPNAGVAGGSYGGSGSGGIQGRAGDPEWSGTPGGFSNR